MSTILRPPRIAEAILRLAFGSDNRETLIGDMREAYVARAASAGTLRASMWFWREAISALFTFGTRGADARSVSAGDFGIASWGTDLRIGARSLRRAPLTTGISVFTLALGIGAIGAVFSVVNPVLFQSLPYPNADKLVAIWELEKDGSTDNTSFATFNDARHTVKSADVAVVSQWQPTISDGGEAERLDGQRVSWNYFRVLGVRPALGRDFTPEEDPPGHRAAMLSHGIWVRRFGADTSVVGTTIKMDGVPYVIAGVMGADFDNALMPNAQMWRTLNYDSSLPFACRTCRHLTMIGRVNARSTVAAAGAELNALSSALVAQYPKDYAAPGMKVVPLQEQLTSNFRDVLYVLLGAAVLLGLIAGANVVNLQITRAMQRRSALAVRLMLGAGRGRIVRLLLAEGLVLAVISAVGAAGVAYALVPVFVSHLPPMMPRVSAIRVDRPTLLLLSGVALSLATVFGLVPAFRFDARGVSRSLRARGVIGFGSSLTRNTLVVTEVALALMLLFGAGLLGRSLTQLLAVDSGVVAANLLTLEVQSTGAAYAKNEAVWDNHTRVLDAVRAIPGVVSAGTSNQIPLNGNVDAYGVRAFDRPLDNPELAPGGDRYSVSTDFLPTLGTRVLKGRAFTDADNRTDAPLVAMISAALAQRIWPGEDPVGKRIQVGAVSDKWREVVGIVADLHHRGLDNAATYQFYVPERQAPFADNVVALVVRTRSDPMQLATAIRTAVHNVDPTQPIRKLAPMTQLVTDSVAQRRLALLLFVAFSSLAVVLAVAGVYGVLASNVTARTREISVRTALGATPARVVGLVAKDSAVLIGLGTVLGLVGIAALGRFLRSLLFGVGPTDSMTMGYVTLGIVVVAMLAAIIPALRALRIEPAGVLRADV